MKQPTTKFPVFSQSYTGALEENPVHLDGQKVLFDKQVTLLPTALKKKDTQND